MSKLFTKQDERCIDLLDSLYQDISDGTFDKGNNRKEYLELSKKALCKHDGEQKNGICLECGVEV